MGKTQAKTLITLILSLCSTVHCYSMPKLEDGLKVTSSFKTEQDFHIQFALKSGFKFTQAPTFSSQPSTPFEVKLTRSIQGAQTDYNYKVHFSNKIQSVKVKYQVCYGREYCFPPSEMMVRR